MKNRPRSGNSERRQAKFEHKYYNTEMEACQLEKVDVVVLKNMHVSKREHLCYATAASGYVDVGDVCFVSNRGDFFQVVDIAKSVHKDVISVLLHRNRVYQVDRKFGGKIEIIPTLSEL